MAGRSRRPVSRKIYQDVGTQTDRNTIEDEIERLREENNTLRQQLKRFNQPKAITVVAAADSPREQPRIVAKGCNCRGKCSTRVCGCVKKDLPCGEHCNCQHTRCQNQDLDKENNAQAENASNLPSSRKNRKIVAEEAAGPSHKHLEQLVEQARSVFSPETPPRPRRELPLGKMTYNETLEFTDKKKTLDFDSDSSSSPPNPKRKITDNEDKDSLKLPAQANGLSNFTERKKKRRFSSDYDGTKPTGVESLQSPVRRKLGGNKGKAKKIERVEMQVGASANGNMEQREEPKNSDDELELDGIDPMKPTRQLQRTPTLPSARKNQQTTSQVPLPRPEMKEEKEERLLPRPKEINEPLVDWEKHCAQLVPCKFCHRTFYPFRLVRHQATCKKT